MKHRESIIEIIQNVAGIMSPKVYIDSDDAGLKIKQDPKSVEFILVVNYIPAVGGLDFVNVKVSITVWGLITHTAKFYNTEIINTLNEFIALVKDAYNQDLEADKLDKQAGQAVNKLLKAVAKLGGVI